jgi:acetyl-CoA synthetase
MAVARAAGRAAKLQRLLKPASVAVVGGEIAAEVIRQCRRIGYAGRIWPVNARRPQIEGLAAFASVDDLPEAPDAAFVAVPREQTVEVVAALARRGAPGAVCYASGFAEIGGEGIDLQRRLVEAAGEMAVLGPNCYGAINFLDGCALWPDRFGGGRVERGVAIVTQSGNIALNLTMQERHLPIAYVITVGNKAGADIHDCIEAMLADPRVTAIGLHLEGLSDIAAFSDAARAALARGVPLVALKAGTSEVGAKLAASHTSSLAGSDVLYGALFERLGIARVADPTEFLETLKFLHTCGPLAGARAASLSCSGGDASLVADLGHGLALEFPPLGEASTTRLAEVLGPLVPIHNPLDYQTYIWGDQPALTACFTALLAAPIDVGLLVLDYPLAGQARLAEGPIPGWDETLNAFIAAHAATGRPALVVSSLSELLPPAVARRLLAAGIAPMQGLREALVAIAAAARVGRRRAQLERVLPVARPVPLLPGPALQLDEPTAKSELAGFGLAVPRGQIVNGVEAAVRAAEAIGYPVVLKAVSGELAHKTEQGAVKLGLASAEAVRAAAAELAARFDRLLVEKMLTDGLAEWIVGVTRDPQFGLSLTIGAGGILVELLGDTLTLLLPVSRADIAEALPKLRCHKLLEGFRGKPPGDRAALVDAIASIAAYAEAHADRLLELDVNPLIVAPRGATAVDALVRLVDAPAPGRAV